MRQLSALLRKFYLSTGGAILVETLLVVPVVTVFAVGVVEFGSVFWQRQQLQAGVRDAARYWARCTPDAASCTEAKARNVAFYGTPAPDGTSVCRVRGWCAAGQLTLLPAADDLPASPDETSSVVVTGTAIYSGSPIFGLLRLGNIEFSYRYEQRYIGW